MSVVLPDGLDALREHLDLVTIMRLIERTAKWVDVETFRLLPIWAPEFARRTQLYKGNWSIARTNRNRLTGAEVLKLEGNAEANKALTEALGLRVRENWSCCHIWSVDDSKYQQHNSVVQDHRFFSCVANMVLLPSPLKAFTDAMPDVKAMLRICAYNYYGWRCDDSAVAEAVARIEAWDDWSAYPQSWPQQPSEKVPPGVVALNDRIRVSIERRKHRIRAQLAGAGAFYPREAVLGALEYWRVSL